MNLVLHQITDTSSEYYNLMISLYLEAFPENERREIKELKRILENEPRFRSFAITDSGNFVGFINYWKLSKYNYVEHIAITKESRGKKYGSVFFSEFAIPELSPLILEVEPPVTKQAEKRISFYRNLGFHVCDIEYVQPAYDTTKPPLPLLLMTHPFSNAIEEIKSCISEIHETVYQG